MQVEKIQLGMYLSLMVGQHCLGSVLTYPKEICGDWWNRTTS